MIEISRKAYCDMYGPTVGDRVRLGDTSLIAEVEKDLTVHAICSAACAVRLPLRVWSM